MIDAMAASSFRHRNLEAAGICRLTGRLTLARWLEEGYRKQKCAGAEKNPKEVAATADNRVNSADLVRMTRHTLWNAVTDGSNVSRYSHVS